MAAQDDFRKAIEAAGLTPPDHIIPDGKLHRFSSNGTLKGKPGWYTFFNDAIPAGAYGCWRTGISETWCSRDPNAMSVADRAAHQTRLEVIRKQRDNDEREQQAEAAKLAAQLWKRTIPAPVDHGYLSKKHVQAYGIRQYVAEEFDRHPLASTLFRWAGSLAVPLRDVDGKLWSLELINDRGDKHFLAGGRKRGNFHLLGTINDVVYITEGYATGATVHEATGLTVAVAFDAGNLLPVAHALRTKHPDIKIIICGDHDESGVGQRKAQEAAEAVGGVVAIPEQHGMDWNDVHVKYGLDAVEAGIAAALAPATPEILDQLIAPQEAPLYTPSKNTAQLHTPPALAQESNILATFEQAVKVCGVVGEERCAKLLFLALTSRLLNEPVSVAVKGISSSGKSFTTEMTLKFFPPAAYISMTAMSERALIYMKEEFAHRTLVIFEAVALREQREKNDSNLTAYFVRSLLSEGRISYPVTVRDKNDGFVTKTIVKEGPTNVIVTTTATELHGENETRLLSLPTNDSREQTKAVMLRIAEGRTREPNAQGWQALQVWLATAEHRVVIPFAGYLAEQIPPIAVRLRRDFKSLLRLIETHALLHQCSRGRDEQGRIVAIEEDYLTIRGLTADLVASGVGAMVADTIRETVHVVQAADQTDGITVKMVAQKLRLDRSAAHRRLQAARERGYLINVEDKRGRPARYAIGEALPEDIELLPKTLGTPWCAHSAEGVQASHTPLTPSESEEMGRGVQVCGTKRGGIEREVF